MASLCPSRKYVIPELHGGSAQLLTECHAKFESLQIHTMDNIYRSDNDVLHRD